MSLVVELFAQLVLRGLDLRGVQQGNHSSSPEAVHHHVFRFDGQVGVFVSDNLVRVLRRGHDAAQRRGGEHGGCRLSQILFPAGELQNLDGSWNRAVFLPQLQQDIDNVRSVDNQFDHPDREGAAAQVQIDGTPSDHGVAVRPLRQQPDTPADDASSEDGGTDWPTKSINMIVPMAPGATLTLMPAHMQNIWRMCWVRP